MTDEFKQKWQGAQLTGWQGDVSRVENFFRRFNIEIRDIYNNIFTLDYDRIQSVMYLIGKIEKMVAICDFLDTLAENNKADVDKIKIFQLVSHSEIAMNTFNTSPTNITKGCLIDKFFEPVKDRLQYTLRLSIDDTNSLSKIKQITSASRILYKLRNEYAHQGNYTSKVFKSNVVSKNTYNCFSFDWDLGKGQTVFVDAETNLTYYEFLDIYFSALKKHLENYTENI